MNKILIIGCGHMGSALLKSWHLRTSYQFIVVDPNQYKKINLSYKKRVNAFKSIENIKNYKKFDIVIFAVKPQIIKIVMMQIKKIKFKKSVLFISIIAGKKISYFNSFLPKKNQFLRVMPNMPVLINEGISCLLPNTTVSNLNKKHAANLFKKVGKIIWLKNENDLNKVTAISGSGPAYYYLFISLLEKASIKLGLSKKISRELVSQTALGSIKLLIYENNEASELVKNIAVKGGTTEAAINVFTQNSKLKNLINKATKAAYNRAIELGKK